MRPFIPAAVLLFTATFAPLGVDGADADTQCLDVGRPCTCVSHVRDCAPTCHIAPQFECAPTNQ